VLEELEKALTFFDILVYTKKFKDFKIQRFHDSNILELGIWN
jgi:hypothetical protein